MVWPDLVKASGSLPYAHTVHRFLWFIERFMVHRVLLSLFGMCRGKGGQWRESLRKNPRMRAGDNLDVGASLGQALVKPNKRCSILDPIITCDPGWVLDFAAV